MSFKGVLRLSAMFFCVALLEYGCSSTNEPVADNASTSSMDKNSASVASAGDCAVDCIDEDGPYFVDTTSQFVHWGGSDGFKFTKTVRIEMYNTLTHFVLRVMSTSGWSDLVVDGVSVWTGGPVAANTWGEMSFPLPSGWQACDVYSMDLQVAGNGNPGVFNGLSYSLIGECPSCETAFNGTAVSCGSSREAVYTFSSTEALSDLKIQGGLTNFTGDDAVVTISGGNLSATQRTPGGSSNRVITVTGSVQACEEVTIRITWNSTNTGGVITGGWSAKSETTGLDLNVDGLSCE